jgi:hypothetical protein
MENAQLGRKLASLASEFHLTHIAALRGLINTNPVNNQDQQSIAG